MTTKHTPGPWHTTPNWKTGDLTIFSPDAVEKGVIGTVNMSRNNSADYAANARLIAAAPDLLVAAVNATIRMRVMRERLRDAGLFCSCADEIDDLDAAIAKATGKVA